MLEFVWHCADEEEQQEVRDMAERRDAENASKPVVQPPPVQTTLKHDWTHHFKAVRQRCSDEEACASADGAPLDMASICTRNTGPRNPPNDSKSDLLYDVPTSVQSSLDLTVT